MAGTTKQAKGQRRRRAPLADPGKQVEVCQVSPRQMQQVLAILGLRDESLDLPSGRFALVELRHGRGEKRVRRVFKTHLLGPPATTQQMWGPARKAEIIAHATEALDGQANAMQWLQQPNRSLSGRTPLEVLSGDAPEEAERVDEILYGIEYGMYA